MRILSLETSTQRGGAAIIVDGQVVGEKISEQQRSHSELLNVFVEDLLKKSNLSLSDIDVFAVGQGPGSFTGIRVASNAGKTFASVFQKPLVTVDSLTQIASAVKDSSRPVLAMLNAYKNMVYYGLFDVRVGEEPKLRGELGVCPVAELEAAITMPVTVVGEGFAAYETDFSPTLKKRMHRLENPSDFPSPSLLGLFAEKLARQGRVLDWKSFVPLYLRASEAEENKRGALFKSTDNQ